MRRRFSNKDFRFFCRIRNYIKQRISGKYRTCFILILSVLLFGCTINTEQQTLRVPKDTRDIIALSLPFTPQKIAYSSLDNSLYVMEQESNAIHIYKNGKHVNKIGGLGFGDHNFSRLSDIAVSPHGRLLALDSFQKTIKKFDSDGMWLENYSIRSLNEPVLFDVSHDGMVFVYDRTSNEIVIFDEKLEDIIYRFGKFLLRDPLQLTCTFLHVTIYDDSYDKTFIFDMFGDLLETIDGFWQIDRFDNKYLLATNKISAFTYRSWERRGKKEEIKDARQPDSDLLLFYKPWLSFSVRRGLISLINENGLQISEIIYERE